jgi:hypothetical protein
MTQFLSDINDDDEIDIQKTVLKKRTTKKEQDLFVEYDRLTYVVRLVSPTNIKPSTKRNLITSVAPSELTDKLFQNKLPLASLVVKRNQTTNQLELSQNKTNKKNEFDFVFASNKPAYIYLNCDLVTKKITVVFDHIAFKSLLAQETILENDLEELPDLITLYCLDKTERSRLLGNIVIPTQELFNLHSLDYPCKWLPDDHNEFDNIGFLYYNDNQAISVGCMNITSASNFKPNILYKQQGNVLKLQSMIKDVNSYRLDDAITLYHYCKYDPTVMLGSVVLNSATFNNYNYLELTLNTDTEIRLMSDYLHLHLEESNDITDYRF